MNIEDFKKIERDYQEYTKGYTVMFENMIAGIAYKYDIPKIQIKEFEKFCAKKLLDSNITSLDQNHYKLIEILEKHVKTFVYNNEFDELIQGPE